jgi:hypothetical protein
MTPKTIFRLALVAMLLLVVALVQVVKSIDVDQYRGVATAWVKRETGFDLSFSGPLTLKLSLSPALVADGVSLFAGKGDSVKLGHVEARIGLLPLLSGEVRITRVWIDGVDLALANDGRAVWSFAPDATMAAPALAFPATSLRVTQIAIDHATLRLLNGDEHVATIEHATLDCDGAASPVALALDGQWDGRHLAVSGILGSQKELFAGDKPYPLQAKILLPGLVASLNGTVRGDSAQGLNMAMALAMEVVDSADLNPLLGIPLPSLGSARAAMTLAGRVDHPSITTIDASFGRHDALAVSIKGSIDDPQGGGGVDLALNADGDAAASLGVTGQTGAIPLSFSGHVTSNGLGAERGWRIADLKGSLGRSDLSGQLSLLRRNGHGVIKGRFDSALVDLTQPREKIAEPPRGPGGDGRFFSDDPLPLQFLLQNEGHLAWHIGRLLDHRLDATGIDLELGWHDGKVDAGASVAAIAGGKAAGHVSIDGAGKPSAIGIEVAASHLVIGDLLSALAVSDAVGGGRVDFRLKAAGSGDTPRAIFASLQGGTLLSVAPASLSNKLAQGGLGAVLTHLSPTIGAASSEVRCLISHFTLVDGLARSEALLFSLGPTLITGQGSVNLSNESLDFTLTPRPPAPSTATSLDVGGSLTHPVVAPNKGAIVKNLPPLASETESPLFALATAEPNPCFAALAQGRRGRR